MKAVENGQEAVDALLHSQPVPAMIKNLDDFFPIFPISKIICNFVTAVTVTAITK